MKKRICIVTSTRADWGLLQPLATRLKAEKDVQLQIVATNMHLLHKYGHTIDDIINAGFDVDAKIEMPDTGDTPADKVGAMAMCMANAASAFNALRPDIVVILGDRYEMLSIASAACVMRLPIAHIAGGETSEGAIDDNIRHAITKLSSLHFTETEEYRRRVVQMGEAPERVVNAGALGVWNITHQPLLDAETLSELLDFDMTNDDVIMVTYHPATLNPTDTAELCKRFLEALDHFQDNKLLITYPNNDAGSEKIIALINDYAQKNPQRVKLVKSLGMLKYLSALKCAVAAVGNSSSGIIEVPSMGIPSVDIGNRQKGRLSAESVIHCTDTPEDIERAIRLALSDEMRRKAAQCQNPYSKPNTVEIIASTLIDANAQDLIPKKFYDMPE